MKDCTFKYLFEEYGPLISLTQLAEIFDRSPEGLRVSLCNKSQFSRQINNTKKKYGRRVYFKTQEIANLIDEVDIDHEY